jgi:NitT/TauT family transport system permease protein
MLWEIAAYFIAKPLLLPSPIVVFARLCALVATSAFWEATLLSFLRVLGGIAFGLILGCLIAMLTFRLPLLRGLLKPLIATVKSTPVASFIILVNLWLDHDFLPVFISFLMVFPVVWANVDEGLRTIDPSHIALAKIYHFPRMRTVRRIYIPTVRPHFISACRSSLGLAWKAGIAAEVLVPSVISIGKHLYESKLYLETTDLFTWTIIVIIFSMLLESIADALFRRLFAIHSHPGNEKEGSI